jgi:hypothetical protein
VRDNAKPCRRYRGRKPQALIPIAQVAVTKIRRHQNWQTEPAADAPVRREMENG